MFDWGAGKLQREPAKPASPVRACTRVLLALFYAAAGVGHLVDPGPFVRITPSWVPAPEAVVALTGVAEILGAVGLVQQWWKPVRRAAAIGLALYALCVWPANFQHLALDLAREDGGWGLGYHIPRLIAQPLIVWLALWAGEATDWPLARRTNGRS